MCGIAGIFRFDGQPVHPKSLEPMLQSIVHRGPDEGAVWTSGAVGLGHRRLSIIDLATGQQPMTTADGSLTITFNGEVFNFLELRRDLESRGHRFRTRSDTEVILHLYAEYGEDCVRHMNGQWAFAIWDQQRRRLFLSRDRMGIRPLHYVRVGATFLFASEVKSLFAHPEVPRRIDPIGLDQIFTFWAPLAPRTVFQDICELPPAHSMVVDASGVQCRRYWNLQFDPAESPTDATAAAEQLRSLLIDATRLRLRSDVPVGAYLSGGLDSSVTTALIKRFTDAPLTTFSVGFEDSAYDESRYQEQVARALRTDHRLIRCGDEDIGRSFPEVIRHTERPVLRTAPAPLFLLSGLVRREGYKVVMTGEGADEVLGGYDIFKEAKIRRFWARQPDSVRRAVLLKQLYPYMPGLQSQPLAYLKAFFHVRPEEVASPFFSHLPRWQLTAQIKRFFSREFRERLRGYDSLAELLDDLPRDYHRWPAFCQAQYLETTGLLPGYILSSQGDRMAMAHSVEGRFPFLDYRVVEFAARLAPRFKMNGLNEKYLLKLAAADLVPDEVLRRPKQPYRAPDARSFFDVGRQRPRFDYVAELLAPERIADDGIFDPRTVARLIQKVQAGRAIGTKDNMAVVGILSTQILLDQFLRRADLTDPAVTASATATV